MTKYALLTALLTTPRAPEPFSADELLVLEEVCSLFRPFEQATRTISGGKYPTIILVIPFMCEIRFKLSVLKEQISTIESTFALGALN